MKRRILMAVAVVLLLGGCVISPETIGTRPTVEDIFTQPPTTAVTDPSTATQPGTEATEPTNPPAMELGGMSFGPTSPSERDEKGRYRVYEGGQMYLPFNIKSSGLMSTYDVGVLLFVDGVAQPYRIGPDGEYAYLHTFSQEAGSLVQGQLVTSAELYFTPVTGEAGQMLEIYAVAMPNPHWVPSQTMVPFSNTSGAIVWESRLKFSATPPTDTFPEKSPRLLGVSAWTEDCTAADVKDWSDYDMITDIRTKFTANGETIRLYGVREDTPITLRYEIWGSPYVHYGLVFFVDNVPVYAADLSDIWVTVQMGQKTIVEVTLDMAGFAGESFVYAMLVPLNHFTSEIETRAYFKESTTIFLLGNEKGA